MKKIFAIALALVMVFSMASAFALNDCSTGFDWTCPASSTLCGKAKFEVVPYVKVNNGCGGYDWQVNDCASAIVSENVYFALKLTLDADVDPEWWAEAEVSVTTEGLAAIANLNVADIADIAALDADKFEYATIEVLDVNGNLLKKVNLKESESQVFYLGIDGWVHEDYVDLEGDDADIYTAEVLDADDAEVCATIASEHDGYGEWTYGDYTVVASKTDASLTITGDCGEKFVMTWAKDKVSKIEASASFLAEVQSVFNLSGCVIGTCVDDEIIQRNFGWDDEFENCFAWSNKGAAVVNPECVVAIPKTGDVSVVAYAVMAVVAAAGAMLKK